MVKVVRIVWIPDIVWKKSIHIQMDKWCGCERVITKVSGHSLKQKGKEGEGDGEGEGKNEGETEGKSGEGEGRERKETGGSLHLTSQLKDFCIRMNRFSWKTNTVT